MDKSLRVAFMEAMVGLDTTLRKDTGKGLAEHAAEAFAAWQDSRTKKPTQLELDFALLNLRQDAPEELVRMAYHLLAKQLHPDANRETSDAAAFAKVQEAYQRIRKARGWA